MNAVERFFNAVNEGDVVALEAAFHPDFEMIVPQHPARGFKGRDQELKNMTRLMAQHPDARITVRRMVESGHEIWVQSDMKGANFEVAAMVVFTVDPASNTLIAGDYYSEPVDHASPQIDDWITSIAGPVD